MADPNEIAKALNNWREVQNPDPNKPKMLGFCLGSSKFFAGKLIGLFNPNSGLKKFHESAWSHKHGSEWQSKLRWGKLDFEAEFNRTALPAAISDPSAGVQNADNRWKNVEFHHFSGHFGLADALLLGRVPLVVGVNYSGGTGLEHYVTILRSKDFRVWVVDSWSVSDELSVVELPMNFSFLNPQRFKTNVSYHYTGTLIPSNPSYFGHYRDKTTKAAIGISRMI